MYYSFYMNEKLALRHWKRGQDCNWLLTNLLCKDTETTVEEKLDFYFKNRNERDGNTWMCTDEDEDFRREYDKYQEEKWEYDCMWEDYWEDYDEELGYNPDMCMPEDEPDWDAHYTEQMSYSGFRHNKFFDKYEESLEHRDENRRAAFCKKTIRSRRMNMKLREVDEVVLYKGDIKALNVAKKEHNLTESQTILAFGLIFFSRMNQVKWCRIGTKFKKKSFFSCFDRKPSDSDWKKVINSGLFYKTNSYKDVARKKMHNSQVRYLHIQDEQDIVYNQFDSNMDEEFYVFKTTLDNNKLNLTKLAKEVIPDLKNKHCSICGNEFEKNSNKQKMCPDCRKTVTNEQAKLRMQKMRSKVVTQ